MKFRFLAIIISCLYLNITAQKGRETKCITGNNGQWSEIFTVLKSDSSVKDGKYQKWVGDEKIVQGNYKNNEKTGKWFFYSAGIVIAEGFYTKNIPTLNWKFYNTYHDLIQVYDFSNDSLLFFDRQLEESYYPDKNPKAEEGKSWPHFVGGQTFLNFMLKYYLNYPDNAAGLKKQGTVMVEFTIDTVGLVKEPVVEKKVGFGMDEEAIRFVSQLDKFWIPGKINGQKTVMRYTLPVTFIYRKY